ncbi:MAG: hypothetical protein [Siphoviridae sp. ctdc_1]|nr:MAG: hypothetical protein [Siphoviridae sp. ctdc_1]
MFTNRFSELLTVKRYIFTCIVDITERVTFVQRVMTEQISTPCFINPALLTVYGYHFVSPSALAIAARAAINSSVSRSATLTTP